MSDVKWIKISTNVFNDECFELIDDMPEADAIELIWFKLLVFAGKQNNNGLFLFKDHIAYTDEMLASIFHRPINVVRLALNTFVSLGMIEQIEGVYAIPNWDKYQNLDAYEQKKLRDKEYSKKYREKQKKMLIEKAEEKKSSDESSDVSRFCSYSISYSNINNINILLNNDYIHKDYINNNNRLLNSIKEWFEYKDEKKPKKDNHYTEKGLRKQLTEFVNKDKEFGTDYVVSVIDKSIASQWKGVIWDAVKPSKPTSNYHLQGTKPIEGETNYQAKLEAEMRAKFGFSED